jgi:nucleoside-diphosphate-sugar epimerase
VKKILVTGANGFVGKNLTKLLKNRKFEVRTTDLIGAVDYTGDLTDPMFVAKLPAVDVVINCAAVQYLSSNIPMFGRSSYFFKNNVSSIVNLRNKYDGTLSFFIHFGSSMMYQKNQHGVYDHRSKFGFNNGIYSNSKIAAFQEFERFHCASAFIIPSIIAGSGRKGFFKSLAVMIKRYRIVIMPGACKHLTSIVHVDDVSALIYAVLANQTSGIFNVASDESYSINDWINLIAEKFNVQVIKIKIPLIVFKLIGFLSFYRLLAKEQLMILEHPQQLDLHRSKDLGWQPLKNIHNIIDDTF